MILKPDNAEEVCAALREYAVVPHGQNTKAPLSAGTGEDTVRLDMSGLSGVLEYEPGEFTFTAMAGTSLKEIESMLAEQGQYLPCDPPLVEGGATLGGTVAAGLSGSGQLRFGGIRDFIIGVKFVDGTARLICGGGKVVKNAAGFDLPKLMTGSMGRLGVLTELTFKVFPKPHAWQTLRIRCHDFPDAMDVMASLIKQPFDLEALDLEPPATLVIRLAGDEAGLPEHAKRVAASSNRPCDNTDADEEARYWRDHREFQWAPEESRLIKFALSPGQVSAFENSMASLELEVPRRYAVAGNLAWLAWPADKPVEQLGILDIPGLIIRGEPEISGGSLVGKSLSSTREAPFASAIKNALDPNRRLPALVGC